MRLINRQEESRRTSEKTRWQGRAARQAGAAKRHRGARRQEKDHRAASCSWVPSKGLGAQLPAVLGSMDVVVFKKAVGPELGTETKVQVWGRPIGRKKERRESAGRKRTFCIQGSLKKNKTSTEGSAAPSILVLQNYIRLEIILGPLAFSESWL